MTEKVKITQEQFDWLERYKSDEEIDYAIDIQLHKKRPDSPVADWKPSEVARALYIGYEIKPEPLKVGDWATEHAGEGYRIGKIKGVTDEKYTVQFLGFETTEYYFELVHCSKLQKSTPEEITEEKERRKWANIGRVVGGFRDGDIALDKFGRVLHTIEEMEAAFQMGDLSGFYPAGSYLSFEEVDSNAATHN